MICFIWQTVSCQTILSLGPLHSYHHTTMSIYIAMPLSFPISIVIIIKMPRHTCMLLSLTPFYMWSMKPFFLHTFIFHIYRLHLVTGYYLVASLSCYQYHHFSFPYMHICAYEPYFISKRDFKITHNINNPKEFDTKWIIHNYCWHTHLSLNI